MTAPSPYNDPEYRAARANLKLHPQRCWHTDCNQPATTIDHVPALAEHTHRRGSGCCRLLPACQPHNYGDGATLGNRLRRPSTPW